MSQLILTVHTGFHDTGSALFEDYTLRAAVQLERLTRQKGDGRVDFIVTKQGIYERMSPSQLGNP
jgi:predicted NodU family carbamoyl transferase